MTIIYLNNEKRVTNEDTTLFDFLHHHDIGNGCAVMVNQVFIPKMQHAQMILNDNDIIDIIVPMQGG